MYLAIFAVKLFHPESSTLLRVDQSYGRFESGGESSIACSLLYRVRVDLCANPHSYTHLASTQVREQNQETRKFKYSSVQPAQRSRIATSKPGSNNTVDPDELYTPLPSLNLGVDFSSGLPQQAIDIIFATGYGMRNLLCSRVARICWRADVYYAEDVLE